LFVVVVCYTKLSELALPLQPLFYGYTIRHSLQQPCIHYGRTRSTARSEIRHLPAKPSIDMLSANVIRSRLVTSMPKSSRSLASSAVRNTQRSTKGISPADSSRKVLLSRAAAGFAAGLSIALYSGWTAQQNGSQAVQCESVDDLIVNRKSDDGETMRRKNKVVNNIGDEHDPTRPKEWDDPEVC
jgi:hypothetical protein